MITHFWRVIFPFAAAALMGGCANNSDIAGVGKALHLAKADEASADKTPLNPNARYLRVTVNGLPVFMAFGYLQPSVDAAPAPTEVWYSNGGIEVVQFRHDHLVKTSGLPTDWRQVRYSHLSEWPGILAGLRGGDATAPKLPLNFTREHDEMPGYRMNIKEAMVLERIQPPRDSQLKGIAPTQLVWLQERVVGQFPGPGRVVHYGVDISGQPRVVYQQQCLAADLCLTWQEWPAKQGGGR